MLTNRKTRASRRSNAALISALGFLCLIFAIIQPGPLFPLDRVFAATVRVEVLHSQDAYPAGGDYLLLFRLRISDGFSIYAPRGGGEDIIPTSLSFRDSLWIRISNPIFPEPKKKKFEYAQEPLRVFSGQVDVKALMQVKGDAPMGPQVVHGEISYQACAPTYCLPPERVPLEVKVRVSATGSTPRMLNQPPIAGGSGASGVGEVAVAWGAGAGLLLSLIGIFLGGLALNLTPCVYPLIPITVSYFGGMSEGITGHRALHGCLYLAGLVLTNSLLGLAASLSGGLLGASLQNPWVLALVSAILLSLASSFFGLWEIRIPAALNRAASRTFGGLFGTFFMGLTLGIVAAPCLGPFILGLLTYVSQKGDPLLGLVYFAVLSLGLGLPLTVLALFSSGLDRLPRSGEWMVWVKKGLGWVLVGMAGYMIQPLIPSPLGRSLLFSAVLCGAGLHLGWVDKSGKDTTRFSYLKKGVGIALLIVAPLLLWPHLQERERIPWIPYDPALVSRAAEEGKPVILDFYADWCEPCRTMEEKVLSDPEIVEIARSVVPLKIDLTTRHPRQAEILKAYQVRGVPTLIFISAEGREEKHLRIQAYVGKDVVLERMKALTGRSVE
jgi:thiol:disulfide interchange protein DsbD